MYIGEKFRGRETALGSAKLADAICPAFGRCSRILRGGPQSCDAFIYKMAMVWSIAASPDIAPVKVSSRTKHAQAI